MLESTESTRQVCPNSVYLEDCHDWERETGPGFGSFFVS